MPEYYGENKQFLIFNLREKLSKIYLGKKFYEKKEILRRKKIILK